MALTKDTAAEKVIARLIDKGEKADGLLKPDVISWIDEALQRLARRIANSEDFSELQREVSLTITGGNSSIDSSLLIDTIYRNGLVQIFAPVALTGLVVPAGPGATISSASAGTFLPTDPGLSLVIAVQPQYPTCNTPPHSSLVLTYVSDISVVLNTNLCTVGTYNATIYRPKIAKWKPRYDSLLQSNLATDIAHYAVRGDKIFFKDLTGSLGFTGSGTLLANFVPTLSTAANTDLPVKLENQLIDTLIEMAYEKQNRKPSSIIQTGESN